MHATNDLLGLFLNVSVLKRMADDADLYGIDEKEEDEEQIHLRYINTEDAHKIKAQLFELCKQGDIDKNELISYNEFASVIQKFLPNTTDKKMHQMFGALDGNHDGNVSYVEFLEDANFNKFLETC